jgi:deazaflavin-dependent oxidoreductase (nitroreductase family)
MSQIQSPGWLYRLTHKMNPRMLELYRQRKGPYHAVLLLTTTGRKSGLKRVTPLQYEEIDRAFYVASARGKQADWYRNIQADPRVEVQVQDRHFRAMGEIVEVPARIADFLQYRLKHNPIFIGLIMHMEGLPLRYSRQDLERFAAQKTLVILRPDRE